MQRLAPLLCASLVLACGGDDLASPYGSGFTSAADDEDDEVDAATGESSSSTTTGESGSSTTGDVDSSSSDSSSTTTTTTGEDPTTGGGGGPPCGTDNDPKQGLVCGDQKQQSYAGLFGDLDQGCGQAFPYQDSIFQFTPPLGGGPVTVSYAVQGNDPGDGAILVLEGACSEGSCVASSLDELPRNDVTFEAIDGVDYWLVFEAPSQQPTYTITVTCE